MKKKIISIIMSLSLIFTTAFFIPEKVEASSSDDVLLGMTIEDDCKLRTEPSKHSDVVANLPADTLLYLTGWADNSYGNIWFEVSYFGKTVYCFSDNIEEHVHEFDVEISNEDGSESCYVCECGMLDSESGMQPTFVPAIVGGGLAGAGALEAGAAAVAAAGAYYGARMISKYVVPVILNEAGSLISTTSEAIESLISEKTKESETEDNSGKKYFKAIIIKNTTDSIELIDYSTPMEKEEACEYIDTLSATTGIYGRLKDFSIKACNIYTPLESDAVALCDKLLSCKNNAFDLYGRSDQSEGVEINRRYINGSYQHYHLFNGGKKSVVHILFGNPLYETKGNITTS